MASFHQQITWHLKKEDLEKLLEEAGDNYTALAFTLGIDDDANMQYEVSLVNTGKANANTANFFAAVAPGSVGSSVRPCPVPPDCR